VRSFHRWSLYRLYRYRQATYRWRDLPRREILFNLYLLEGVEGIHTVNLGTEKHRLRLTSGVRAGGIARLLLCFDHSSDEAEQNANPCKLFYKELEDGPCGV
jgi:hypothetical protein